MFLNSIISYHQETEMCLLAAGQTFSVGSVSLPRKKRRKNRNRTTAQLWYILQGDEEYFRSRFRMGKVCFSNLVKEIKALGYYQTWCGRGNPRRRVTCPVALAMAILYVSHGGKVALVADATGYSPETVRLHCKVVIQVISDIFFSKQVRMPDTDEYLEYISSDFLNRCHIPRVIGAIDGTHFPILTPSEAHVDYINRKGTHSIVFQAIAIGTDLRFIEFSGGWAGSVGDSMVFKQSTVFQKFVSRKWEGYRLLGDAAYGLSSFCLTPFERSDRMTQTQKNYNFWQSSGRMVVERAFGCLKKRFPILQTAFTSDDKWLCTVAKFCVTIHNMCCKYREEDWVETLDGDTDHFNFDSDEHVRALGRVGPTAEAVQMRNVAASAVPRMPTYIN